MAERAGPASAEAKAPIPWNEALGKMKAHIKGWDGQGLLDATKVVDDAIAVITHPEFKDLTDEGKTGLARGMQYIFQKIPRARGEVQSQLAEVIKTGDQNRFSQLVGLIGIGGLDGDKVIASLREQAESAFAQQPPQGSGHAAPPWHGRTPAASAPSGFRPGLIPSKSQLDAEANVEHTSRPAEPTDEKLKLLSEKDVEHEADAPAEPDGGYPGDIVQNGEKELGIEPLGEPEIPDPEADIEDRRRAVEERFAGIARQDPELAQRLAEQWRSQGLGHADAMAAIAAKQSEGSAADLGGLSADEREAFGDGKEKHPQSAYDEMMIEATSAVTAILSRESGPDEGQLIEAISKARENFEQAKGTQTMDVWSYLNQIGLKLRSEGKFKAAAACFAASLETVEGEVTPMSEIVGYAANFIQANTRLLSEGADISDWLVANSRQLVQSKYLVENFIEDADPESDIAKQGQKMLRQLDELFDAADAQRASELPQTRFDKMTADVVKSVMRVSDNKDLSAKDFIEAEKMVSRAPDAGNLEGWDYANRVGSELLKMGKPQVAAAFFRVALEQYQTTDNPQPEVIAKLTQNITDANVGAPPWYNRKPVGEAAPSGWRPGLTREEADHAKSPASVSETRDRILKEWMGELPGALISLGSERVAELRTRLQKAGVGIPDLKVEAGESMTVDDVHSLIRKANKLEGFDWGETEVLVNLPEYMRNEEFFANLMESRRDAVVNTRVVLEEATSGLGNLRFRRKGRAAEDYRRAVRDLATHQALIDMVKAEAETKNLIARDALPSFRPLIEITPREKQVLVEMLRKAMIERRDTVIKGGGDIPEAEFARVSLGEPTPNGSKFFFIPRLLDQIYNEGLQNVDDYNSVEFTQKALDVIRQASRQTVIDSLNNMERLEIAYELRIETSAPNWENDSRVRAIYRPMEEVFPKLLK